MASRYDDNTTARVVRLLREHAGDYETEWAPLKPRDCVRQYCRESPAGLAINRRLPG